jgi:hypothetical protein
MLVKNIYRGMGKFQDVFELLSMERKICVAGHEKYVS